MSDAYAREVLRAQKALQRIADLPLDAEPAKVRRIAIAALQRLHFHGFEIKAKRRIKVCRAHDTIRPQSH
jgi:hypothetical protein